MNNATTTAAAATILVFDQEASHCDVVGDPYTDRTGCLLREIKDGSVIDRGEYPTVKEAHDEMTKLIEGQKV